MIVNGTTYKDETPDEVIQALERARLTNKRVRLYYGDHETGRDWLEENDVTGYIGRSMGPRYCVPILLYNSRSIGGPALLDGCIVRLLVDGREVYRTPNYKEPVFTLTHEGPGDLRERVYVDGKNIANFRTEKQALRWIAFMKGERRTR